MDGRDKMASVWEHDGILVLLERNVGFVGGFPLGDKEEDGSGTNCFFESGDIGGSGDRVKVILSRLGGGVWDDGDTGLSVTSQGPLA